MSENDEHWNNIYIDLKVSQLYEVLGLYLPQVAAGYKRSLYNHRDSSCSLIVIQVTDISIDLMPLCRLSLVLLTISRMMKSKRS